MKAIVKTERTHGGIKVLDLPVPEPGDQEVLVRIKNASVCGSDLHAYHFAPTHHFIQPPVIMGHECSGEVCQVGSGVTDFKPGDRVVIEAIHYCGECESCRRGYPYICNNFQIRGMHRDGVFAEYTVVEPRFLHRIPDSLSFEQACLVEPCSVLTHAVYDRSGIKGGDAVLVTGPGPIGLLAAQVVRAAGAQPVVAGIGSDEEIRLPIARQLGFPTINLSSDSLEGKLQEYFGRTTVHAVVECSGAPAVFQQSLDIVAKGGGITLVGLFAGTVECNLSVAVRKEISVFASYASNWHNFERAITMLDKGLIRIDEMAAYYDPQDAVKAFEDAIAKKVPKPVFRFA